MTLTKKQFEDQLVITLKALPEALSAWMGGARATGTEDSYSDTDVVLISSEPKKIFQAVEEQLQSSLEMTWTVEASLWKGFHQKFYILQGTEKTYYIDFGIFTSLDAADYAEFFNSQRHGNPDVLFDKTGILQQASELPPKDLVLPQVNANFTARAEVMYRTFLRETLRGKYIDSFAFFQRLLFVWVQAVRLKYAPQKHDFGLRYIYRDLPQTEAERIEKYLKVHDLETMKSYALEIRDLVNDIVKENP